MVPRYITKVYPYFIIFFGSVWSTREAFMHMQRIDLEAAEQ